MLYIGELYMTHFSISSNINSQQNRVRMFPSCDITFVIALMNSFTLYMKRSITVDVEIFVGEIFHGLIFKRFNFHGWLLPRNFDLKISTRAKWPKQSHSTRRCSAYLATTYTRTFMKRQLEKSCVCARPR